MAGKHTTDPAARAALLGAAAAPTFVLEPGTTRNFGKYELLASIGQGGMGEVYVAQTREPPNRLHAMKVLSEAASRNKDVVGMFVDEAAIMTQIVHPNVLDIFDFGQAESRFYIAMEYLQGRSLARLIIDAFRAEGAIDPAIIAAVGADAARGLHAAHCARGRDGKPLNVVHRDVSPENLFVTYAGPTKVIDFGIARASDRVTRTSAGVFKGKASYMSPEQVASEPLDATSDVFALGICLWEMTTGRRLFLRETQFESLNAVQEAPIAPPSEVTGRADPALDAIILHALDRDRRRRVPSGEALANALDEYARGRGVASPEDRAAVAALAGRLFGREAEEERRLMREVLARKTTEEMVDRLRELSGVAPAPGKSMSLTFAGRPGDAEAWDDYGSKRAPVRADVRSAIDALHAELVTLQKTPSAPPPQAPAVLSTPLAAAEKKGAPWLVIGALIVIALAALATVFAMQDRPTEVNIAPIEDKP